MNAHLDPDLLEDDDLDDFESDDFEDVDDADHSYLDGMWSVMTQRSAEALVTAHGMVQSFVNAFARDGHYVVSFDKDAQTAGTDMKARRVVITPAPVVDPSLTPEQAGQILTGLAVHEISHPRYGRNTWEAVVARFPRGAGFRISNLLDDIRIERRFVADYPGYAGIFQPVLDYVGASMGNPKASMGDLVNLAILATRYPTQARWDATTQAEAKWWTDWADRWSKEDAPRRHVAGVREALAHIVAVTVPQPKPSQTGKGAPEAGDAGGDESTDDGAAGGLSSGEISDILDNLPSTPDDESKDAALDAIAKVIQDAMDQARADASESDLPACSGSGSVDQAARDSGVGEDAIQKMRDDAETILEAARSMQDDGHGRKVDVAQSVKGLIDGGYTKASASSLAARYIRNAILRSRTGNAETVRHQSRGRLDQHGLARIAVGDNRLFERRKAPSPGRYNVWLMIDRSSSMDGQDIRDAATVAHAIASATYGTPNVRMTVWCWSNAFRPSPAYAGVAKLWTTGQDADEILRAPGLDSGGTPDATILGWAARAIKRETRADEQPVILMISDGAGDYEMSDRVKEARKLGVDVRGVSFGMSDDAMEDRYGRHGFIAWDRTIMRTARPLAQLFARITSGR